MARRRKHAQESAPAVRLTSEQLVDLIDHVRAKLTCGAASPEALEAALANLEAEALRRNIALPGIEEPRMTAPAVLEIDQEEVRAVLLLSAKSQELGDFARALSVADLGALWFAFRQVNEFADTYERILALEQIAHYVTRCLPTGPGEAAEFEAERTERLSEVKNPLAWLEQEVLRLFHHTLRFGGHPTGRFFGEKGA